MSLTNGINNFLASIGAKGTAKEIADYMSSKGGELPKELTMSVVTGAQTIFQIAKDEAAKIQELVSGLRAQEFQKTLAADNKSTAPGIKDVSDGNLSQLADPVPHFAQSTSVGTKLPG